MLAVLAWETENGMGAHVRVVTTLCRIYDKFLPECNICAQQNHEIFFVFAAARRFKAKLVLLVVAASHSLPNTAQGFDPCVPLLRNTSV
jgi:hypothetical protein